MPPILTIVGYSGSGKTTLMVKLIRELRERGLKVGTIKHHHGHFELDRPGKDSWRHKQAGALATVISSPTQIGMVRDSDHDHSPDELAWFLTGMDIILCEGFKGADKPKVEVFRSEVHEKPLFLKDGNLIALVSDERIGADVRRFSTDDVKGLSDFLIGYFSLDIA